jgi:hypothetical protein
MAQIVNQPETLNLTLYKNDSAPQLDFILSGVSTLVSARMIIAGDKDGRTLTTSQGGGITLTVADGDTTLAVAPWIVDLPSGSYHYDLETTDNAGLIKTYIAGTITVTRDVR